MNENVYAIFANRFLADPATVFLRLDDGRSCSFGDLDRETARYANLLASLGLQPGDRVAAQVEKSAEAVFLYLGALRAGLVFLPMNPAYQRSEVSYFLGDAQPGVFVCRPQNRQLAAEMARNAGVAHVMELADDGQGELSESAARQSGAFETVRRSGNDLASILYTSGTTGRSKGAMLSHRNLASNALVLHEYWKFRRGDVLLHVLPIFHVHGLFTALHSALANGNTVLFEPKFDARRVLALLPHATVFMGVPTYYTRLLTEDGFSAALCRHMRLFISGSAPLLPDTFDEFKARIGHTILERYGMTETGMLCSNPYDGERRGGTVGFPLPGTSLRIVDDADQPCATGAIGNIQVRGENVFSGYWRMPERNKEEFTPDGWFRTGDMGKLDVDGYVCLIGRSKDLIITGGLNVYPKEIEAIIDAMPGVVESAVIGVPHPDLGEQVTAVVVRAKGAAEPSADEIIAALKSQVAGFKVPKQVHIVDELPRNTMGKVQKNLLRSSCSR